VETLLVAVVEVVMAELYDAGPLLGTAGGAKTGVVGSCGGGEGGGDGDFAGGRTSCAAYVSASASSAVVMLVRGE
jgi:hypothetical protein